MTINGHKVSPSGSDYRCSRCGIVNATQRDFAHVLCVGAPKPPRTKAYVAVLAFMGLVSCASTDPKPAYQIRAQVTTADGKQTVIEAVVVPPPANKTGILPALANLLTEIIHVFTPIAAVP